MNGVRNAIFKMIYSNDKGYSIFVSEDVDSGEIYGFTVLDKNKERKELSFIENEVMKMQLNFYKNK